MIRLNMKVEDGKIVRRSDSRPRDVFRAIACGSALTELILGKSLVDARQLGRDELIAAVGGVPQASTHAAQLALDVLSAALLQAESQFNP